METAYKTTVIVVDDSRVVNSITKVKYTYYNMPANKCLQHGPTYSMPLSLTFTLDLYRNYPTLYSASIPQALDVHSCYTSSTTLLLLLSPQGESPLHLVREGLSCFLTISSLLYVRSVYLCASRVTFIRLLSIFVNWTASLTY